MTEQPTPSPSGTSLTIVVEDGAQASTTWQLTCDPTDGTHPNATEACRVLAAHGRSALPRVPKDRRCTQVYGGPQRATITGTWQGQQVNSTFSRVNGCEINRWDALSGLLPPVKV